MKAGSKFSDGSQMFHLACGEIATVEKDTNGFWGFTTNKGYNLWEGERETATKKECLAILRKFDAETVLNKKYDN
jgi:hypothetical protein